MRALLAHVLVVLVATASPALAETRPPPTLPFELIPRQETVSLVNECPGTGLVAKVSRVIGTARVTMLHGCELRVRTILAIRTLDGWFLSQLAERLPEELDREDLQIGQLHDGTRAVVHSIEAQLGRPRPIRFGYVQVCSVAGPIACTPELPFECADSGCIAPTLSRGRLTIVDSDRGTQQYVLNRVTAPEPRR